MKNVIIILMVFVFFGCEDQENNNCSTPATIGSGGAVFILEDGTRLVAYTVIHCGPFEYVEGKKVFISYEPIENMEGYCTDCTVVKITCLTEADSISEE